MIKAFRRPDVCICGGFEFFSSVSLERFHVQWGLFYRNPHFNVRRGEKLVYTLERGHRLALALVEGVANDPTV
jgi:hypothetical protein